MTRFLSRLPSHARDALARELAARIELGERAAWSAASEIRGPARTEAEHEAVLRLARELRAWSIEAACAGFSFCYDEASRDATFAKDPVSLKTLEKADRRAAP